MIIGILVCVAIVSENNVDLSTIICVGFYIAIVSNQLLDLHDNFPGFQKIDNI